MRRLLLLGLVAGMLGASLATAAEPLTKQQIVNRSGPICADIIDATTPHLEKAQKAADDGNLERFIRESRHAIAEIRERGPDLRALVPPTGARNYRRFVRQGTKGVSWLEAALDALEAGRQQLAESRREIGLEHIALARRAAKRYGLRRSCIRLVS